MARNFSLIVASCMLSSLVLPVCAHAERIGLRATGSVPGPQSAGVHSPVAEVLAARPRDSLSEDLERASDAFLRGVAIWDFLRFERVAMMGTGRYAAAQDAEGGGADTGALQADTESRDFLPSKVIFRDDFDGEFLSDQWDLLNPNEDTILVEDGYLQILTDTPDEKLFDPRNLVILKKTLPREWEALLKLRFTLIDTGYPWYNNQMAGILLYKDKDNGIMFAVSSGVYSSSDDEAVHFERVRQGKWVPGFLVVSGKPSRDHEMTIRLQRIKRQFVASFMNAEGQWQEIGRFTVLRPDFRLGIFALRGSDKAHEALEMFDFFELRAPK